MAEGYGLTQRFFCEIWRNYYPFVSQGKTGETDTLMAITSSFEYTRIRMESEKLDVGNRFDNFLKKVR